MLARQRLRRFAVGALEDHSAPWGPCCDDVGPIGTTCSGHPMQIDDSPTGFFDERIAGFMEDESDSGLPYIAVYVEEGSISFDSPGQLNVPLDLIVEIYVTASGDYLAEDRLDELQSRVMFRLMRYDPIVSDGFQFSNMIRERGTSMQVATTRDASTDRRVFMRTLRINVDSCDRFNPPDCEPNNGLCLNEITINPAR